MAEQEEGIESVSFLDGLISQETRRRTREYEHLVLYSHCSPLTFYFRQTQPLIDACCSPGCIRSTVLTIGIASLVLTALLITVSYISCNQLAAQHQHLLKHYYIYSLQHAHNHNNNNNHNSHNSSRTPTISLHMRLNLNVNLSHL